MKSDHHMNRLLQGDMGSGKSVAGWPRVSGSDSRLSGCLNGTNRNLVSNTLRVYRTFFPEICSSAGSLKAAEKREVLETIAKGEADLDYGNSRSDTRWGVEFVLA